LFEALRTSSIWLFAANAFYHKYPGLRSRNHAWIFYRAEKAAVKAARGFESLFGAIFS